MKKLNRLFTLGALSMIFLTSCDDDPLEDPIIPNEEEVITTLHYTLISYNGGDTIVFTFQDLDGDGGNPPIVLEGTLDSNTSYSGTILLLNEIENPAEDITTEVADEAEDHQFFYQTALSDLNITYNDMDINGDPIGISTQINTNGPGMGTLVITLRHEPNKGGSGVSDGDISNAGGETDIEVTFNVEIQ